MFSSHDGLDNCSCITCFNIRIDQFSIKLIWPITLFSGLGFIFFFYICYKNLQRRRFLFLLSHYPCGPFVYCYHKLSLLRKTLFLHFDLWNYPCFHWCFFFLQYRKGWGILSQPKTLSLATLAMIVHRIVTLMDAKAVLVVEPMVQFFRVSMIAVIPLRIYFSLNRPKDSHAIVYLFEG